MKYSEEQKNEIKNSVLTSLKNGASIPQACKAANIDRSTIWMWRKTDENFGNQVYEAKDSRIDIVEDALYINATEKMNITAQIFFLKNRSKGRWKDKQEIEHSGKIELNNLTDEEIDEYLDRLSEKRRTNDKDGEEKKED
jgi:transposase-like protein